jgi:hypothetical protein
MRTSCVRPGCGGVAAAAVLIDREEQVVVLQPPGVGGPGSIVLCARHVERVTTPVGWQVHDLRVVAIHTIDPPEPVTAAVGAPVPVAISAPPPDSSLRVDDGATPLLGRAFRAASPGELKRPGETRGFAWLERRHGLLDGPGDLGEVRDDLGHQGRDREPGQQQRQNGSVGPGDDEPHHGSHAPATGGRSLPGQAA